MITLSSEELHCLLLPLSTILQHGARQTLALLLLLLHTKVMQHADLRGYLTPAPTVTQPPTTVNKRPAVHDANLNANLTMIADN